jgi:hypothetical protein
VAFNIRKAYTTKPPTIGIPPFIFPNPAFFIEQATRTSLLAANRLNAGVAIGSIGISAGTGIAGINSAFKQKEKKQFGGILQGPLHQNGGITTPYGELEGGEYVVNRASTMMFRPTLDRINGLGGGVGDLTTTGNSNTLNGNYQPIIKTYVVASEMSSQQETDRIIKERSLF